MTSIRFEWDESKNRSNQRKHGVSFEQAAIAFRDPFHFSVQDRLVDGEERWQTFGWVEEILLVMVAHTLYEDETETAIRIISARAATPTERRRYEEENS